MTDAYLDGLLDELVTAESRGEWTDVLRRARRSRRRYVALVTGVAALVLVPGAWAIAQTFEGKPAPRSIRSEFRFDNRMRAKIAKSLGRREPRAIASKAHGVIQAQTADGPIDLWAAPASHGGTCFFVGWESDLRGTTAGGSATCAPATAPRNNLELGWGGDYLHRNYVVVKGYAYGDATSVRVTRSDGSTATLPVVEGLFLGALRQSVHWRLRPKIISVVTRDPHGQIVGYWRRSSS